MKGTRCSIYCSLIVKILLFQGLWLTAHSVAEDLATSDNESSGDEGSGEMVVEVDDTPSRVAYKCPPEWDSFAQSCYRVFGADPSERKNWEEAFYSCGKLGSILVTVQREEEQDYLSSYTLDLNSDIWIGMHLDPESGIFKWTDASKSEFNAFDENEPALRSGSEECIEMRYNSTAIGKWANTLCDRELPYICVVDKEYISPEKERKVLKRGLRNTLSRSKRQYPAQYSSYYGSYICNPGFYRSGYTCYPHTPYHHGYAAPAYIAVITLVPIGYCYSPVIFPPAIAIIPMPYGYGRK